MDISNFKFLNCGQVDLVVKPAYTVAIIHFTRFDQITEEELEQLNRFTIFLFKQRKYLIKVKNCQILCGRMWAVGWRKAYTKGEFVGLYGSDKKFRSYLNSWEVQHMKFKQAGVTIGKIFKQFAAGAFQQNQEQLREKNIPSFSHLGLFQKMKPTDFAAAITYTENNFSNKQHKDNDGSEFAFGLWITVSQKDGHIVQSKDMKPTDFIFGGTFVFPCIKVAIDFSSIGGVKLGVFDSDFEKKDAVFRKKHT